MAGFKMPTFDDTPAVEPEVAAAPAPVAAAASKGGFKMPTFEDNPVAAPTPAEEKPKMKPFLSPEQRAHRDGVDKSVFNGLMLGMGDRVRAYTGIGAKGETYDERLATVQAEREQFNKENPALHYLTEGVPGLVTGSAVTRGAGAALGKVAPAVGEFMASAGKLPALARVGAALGTGAGFGAVGGAGAAKPGEMGKGATEGATIGALATGGLMGVGGLVKGAVNVATPMAQKVMMMLGVTDPEKWAEKKMVDELLAQGHTIESTVAKMKDLANKGAWTPQAKDFVGPPMAVPPKPIVLADALPPKVLGMVKKAGSNGPAAEIIEGKLGQRAIDAPDRIANDIATNISDRTGASAEAMRIVEGRTAAAKPLYDAAFARPVADPAPIHKFFEGPLRKNLFRTVEETQRGNLTPLQGRMTIDPKTQEFKIVETPSIADLHTMRSKLSKMRSNLWDDASGSYKGNEKIGGGEYDAGDLKKHMDDLDGLIENLTGGKNGDYAQARKIFADDSSVLDALRKGGSIIKTRPEDVAIEFGKLKSEAERDAYRAGISSVLTDKTGSTANGAAILKSIFGNKNIRAKLDQVYPNDEARTLFPKQMAAEQKMQETTKVLAPGVKKQDFLESGGDASLPAAIANGLAGRPVAAAANAARFVAGQAERMHPLYGEQLAKLGMMGLPEAETFAANMARRNSGALSTAGRYLKGVASEGARMTPYVGGNLMARQEDGGALERLRQHKEGK